MMAKAVDDGAKTIQGIIVNLVYHTNPNELQNSDALIIGTPTYNHNMTLDIQNLLEKCAKKNINLKGKAAATFGSYGWSGEAVKLINKELEAMKFELVDPGLKIQYVPDDQGLEAAYQLGKKIARALPGK